MPPKSTRFNQSYYVIHPIDKTEIKLTNNYIIASFDMGINNMAVRIEQRENNTIIPLYFERKNLPHQGRVHKLPPDVMNSLTIWLKTIPSLRIANYIIIESQLTKNISCSQLEYYLIGLIRQNIDNNYYIKDSCIISINSKLKSSMLKAPKSLIGKQLKKWAEEQAEKLMSSRADYHSLKYYNSNKKKDDLADALIQIEAFVIWINEHEIVK